MSISLPNILASTARVIAEWGESLTIKRSTVVYGPSGSTETWTTVATQTGAWQALSGSAQRAEAGLQVKSDAQVLFEPTANVQVGDRIYRADGSWMTVNYTKIWPDHITAFLTKTTGEPA